MAPKTPRKLTPKEDLFVGFYLISFNASDAYRKAGYKGKSVAQLAHQLLIKPHIQAAIRERFTEVKEKQGVTQERVVAELAKVGFATMRQFMRVDQEGQPQIDLTETDDDNLDALSEISTETVLERDGQDSEGKAKFTQVRKTKIKLHDKLNALDKLARFTGVYEKEAEHAAGALAIAITEIQQRMSKAPIRRDTSQDDKS